MEDTGMDDEQFLVFGSVLTKGSAARDIDMIVPEFGGDDPAEVSLDAYELVAHETGKSIDLFFTRGSPGFNVAAWYDIGTLKWTFRWSFCGSCFFECRQAVERRELIAMCRNQVDAA
jgi:hypothetical protein